jgi:hypothetical protein
MVNEMKNNRRAFVGASYTDLGATITGPQQDLNDNCLRRSVSAARLMPGRKREKYL